MATFAVSAHFAIPKLPVVNGNPNGPSLPTTLEDARSMFLGYHYSLARLSAEPMRPRLADSRIGHFVAGTRVLLSQPVDGVPAASLPETDESFAPEVAPDGRSFVGAMASDQDVPSTGIVLARDAAAGDSAPGAAARCTRRPSRSSGTARSRRSGARPGARTRSR